MCLLQLRTLRIPAGARPWKSASAFFQNSPPGAAPSGQLHRLRSLVFAEAQPLPRPSTSQAQFPNPSLRGAFSRRHPSMHCDVMRHCNLLCERSNRTATGLSLWIRVHVALCECYAQHLAESGSAELDTRVRSQLPGRRVGRSRWCQSNERARHRIARGRSVAARFSVPRPELHVRYSVPAPGPATRRRTLKRRHYWVERLTSVRSLSPFALTRGARAPLTTASQDRLHPS